MNAKEEAVKLRKEGYSYSFIANKTGLSKSTLSYHLSNLPYIPNKYTTKTIGKALAASARAKAKIKKNSIDKANQMALKDIGVVTNRDLFMLGIGLYIGEGSKTQDMTRMVNADYRVINMYIAWLKLFGLKNSNFVIRLHLYPNSNVSRAEDFWSKKISLPKSQFQKPSIDMRTNKDRKRSGTHVHGTAHVSVKANGKKEFGVFLSRRIGAWMEEVLQYRP